MPSHTLARRMPFIPVYYHGRLCGADCTIIFLLDPLHPRVVR